LRVLADLQAGFLAELASDLARPAKDMIGVIRLQRTNDGGDIVL